MATEKQMAALKKARAARKRNLKAAGKKPVKKRAIKKVTTKRRRATPADGKRPVKRKSVAAKRAKLIREKTVTTKVRRQNPTDSHYLVINQKGKVYYYTGKGILFDDDRHKAVSYSLSVAKKMVEPLAAFYRPHKMTVTIKKK